MSTRFSTAATTTATVLCSTILSERMGYLAFTESDNYGRQLQQRAAAAINPLHIQSAANVTQYDGNCEDDINIMNNDLHDCSSLHLRSLIEDYLEPSCSSSSVTKTGHSFGSCGTATSLHATPAHFPACEGNTEKNALHELQAILREAGREYTGLRREVTRAVRKAESIIAQLTRDLIWPFKLQYEHAQAMVLEHFQEVGFNAGICKCKKVNRKQNAKMTHFPTEEYVYMDVIAEKLGNAMQQHVNVGERVIIDLLFKEGFQIARPTPAYVDLLKVVPTCYVGSPRVLHRIIKQLSRAMKRSFASQGMPLPPWRNFSFLHSKWLSPHYSRTLTPISTPSQYDPILARTSSKTPQNPPSSTSSKKKSTTLPSQTIIKTTVGLPSTENSLSTMNTSIQPHPLNPSLHLIGKLVLTNCNSMTSPLPQPFLATKTSSSRFHVMPDNAKYSWQLPPLSRSSNSLMKPRKLVGALAIALQDSSITLNTKSSASTMTSSYLFNP